MAAPAYPERDEFEGTYLADKYLICRRIGRGGMGAVYEATHVLMDRTVAIKVVRPHYAQNDASCLQRFRLEAKASSCLNHPNIMTVFDFGITEQGVAYLVMDHIAGEGLDVVLRRERLSVERVVDIFSQACNALAHAHDKGVVHRDLKPSNIMLLRDDEGREVVKIVDFGIAKMLPGRSRAAEVINDGGQVIGSPLYMSPEQCVDDEQDGRSDVYSLGCLLYEALTGQPPISDKHVLGIIYKHLNEMPRPLSAVAPERQISAALEKLVLKALSKRPADRQQNMREFLAELQHAAASGGNAIESTHYVDRPAAAECLFSDEPTRITDARSLSSDAVEQHYLRQLRSAADQFGAMHPDVVPAMHQLADYYVSRNKPSRAERQLRTAIEVLVENYGPWDVRVADSVLKLAELYRNGGRLLDAEPLYLDALSIKKTELGTKHQDVPFVLLRLAELYAATGQLEASYKYYSNCLRSAEGIFGADDPVLSAIIIGMASILLQQDKLDQAAWLYNRALELCEFNLGPSHPAVINPLISLAVVFRNMQNMNGAEEMLKRAITVHRENFDRDTSEICHAYWILAEVYSHRGKLREAEGLYEHVLAFFEHEKGDDESVAQLYNNYGVHFVRQQEMERAEVQFIKALKIRERKYGRSSQQVASSLNLIATLYHAQEKLELAEEYYRRSLNACEEAPEHLSELASENFRALGDLYTTQQRFDEAEPAYIKALEVRNAEEKSESADDPQTKQIISSLLNLYAAANGLAPGQKDQAYCENGSDSSSR